MFYYSNESRAKVVHYEGCHHLKKIKKENLMSFDSIRDVRKGEYRICSCCSPITEHLRNERKELENFCQENGLAYFVNKGNLYIRTNHSKWKVLVSNSKEVLELHHKNSFEKEHDNSVPGYHRQNYISDSIIGYMEYITNHEYYRMYNPVPIYTKKEPPTKGTKRWNKQQKAARKKERRRKIWNVINLIDSLSVGTCVAHA